MAGATDKTVRELIREAEAAAASGTVPQSGAEGAELAVQSGVDASSGMADLGARVAAVAGAPGARVEARAHA